MIRELFSGRSVALGLLFALLLSPFQNFIEFLIIPIFIIFLLFFDKTDLILFLIISSFLVFSRSIGSDFRDLLQYFNLTFLGIMFIIRNLHEEIKLPRLSKELVQFLVFYFSALIIASIFANKMFAGWQHILRQIIFFGIIYILYSLIGSLKTVIYFVTSILIAALFHTFLTLYALYQQNFDIMAFGSEYFLSLSSDLMTNKNTIGIYIIYALIFNLTLFIYLKNVWLKFSSILITLLLTFGLFLINSRAVILALIVAGLYLLYSYRRKVFYYSLIILASCIALLFIPPFDELVSFYFRVEDLLGQRDIIIKSSWSLIENEWLLGTGPGGTKELLYKYIPFMLGTPEELWIRHHFNQIEYGHAHNYFLFMLSDLGVLGLLSAGFLIFAFLRIGNRVRRYYSDKDKIIFSLTMAILSLGIGMFVRGLFEWGGILGYGMINTDLPFWISFAILIYFDRKRIETADRDIVSKRS